MFKRRWIHAGYTQLCRSVGMDGKNCHYIQDLDKFFEFEFQPDDVVVLSYMIEPMYYDDVRRLLDRGVKFVNDGLWDCYTSQTRKFTKLLLPYQENGLTLHGHARSEAIGTDGWNEATCRFIPMYFWYAEAIESMRRKNKVFGMLGSKSKKFFMSVGNVIYEKEMFLQLLSSQLNDDAIYSIRSWEKFLPDDRIDTYDDRYVNPRWYEDTSFSIVVESQAKSLAVNMTEKTFKPIQYGHPFIVFGNYYILKTLQQYGFKTYNMFFNEEYDNIIDSRVRAEFIADQIAACRVDRIHRTYPNVIDNWNRFHDWDIMQSYLKFELINHLRQHDG